MIPGSFKNHNAGEGAVEAYRGIPLYPETQYVDRILRSTGMHGTPQIIYRYDTPDGRGSIPTCRRRPAHEPAARRR